MLCTNSSHGLTIIVMLFGIGFEGFIGDTHNIVRVVVTIDSIAGNVGHTGLDLVELLDDNGMRASFLLFVFFFYRCYTTGPTRHRKPSQERVKILSRL
jgi:hypothetical protein